MKNKKTIKYLFSLTIFISMFIISCTDYDKPGLINDPNKQYPQSPSITEIEPIASAIAGVREIIINGQNFPTGTADTLWVFIGNRSALIKSITANRIIAYRPPNSGDSLTIKVVNPEAESVTKVDGYNLELPVAQFGDYSRYNYALMAIEVDKQENLYVASRRVIFKAPPDGIEIDTLTTLGSDFAEITDMKLGPGGYLYIAVDQREIYRLDPVTIGNPEQYFRVSKRASRIDFDTQGNLYTGRRDGIIIIDAAKNELPPTGHYSGTNIVELRVFNNELYVATANGLFKNEILSNGTLGSDQSIVQIKNVPGFSTCDISSFNIAIDGTIYLCLQGHPQYSLFVLENDGSVTPFYTDNILPQDIDQIIYGSGRYMYLNRGMTLPRDSVRLYRMGMENIGAPYPGRN